MELGYVSQCVARGRYGVPRAGEGGETDLSARVSDECNGYAGPVLSREITDIIMTAAEWMYILAILEVALQHPYRRLLACLR